MEFIYINSDEPDELLKVDNLVMDAVWLLEIEKKWSNGGFVNGSWRQKNEPLESIKLVEVEFSPYLFININKQGMLAFVACSCWLCFKVIVTNLLTASFIDFDLCP